MSEKGNLFKTLSVRFSLANEQHVRCLQNIEQYGRDTGESKSQLIIKALGEFFGGLEADKEQQVSAAVKKEIEQYADRIKEKLKNEVRQELMAELFGMLAGINLRGTAEPAPAASPGKEGVKEAEDSPGLDDNEDIVANVMKWG